MRDEQRNKLEQMASLEKPSVSNLIENMADERRKRLLEQQGVAYAKTLAQAMNLKIDADNPPDREKLRRAIRDPAPEKNAAAKTAALTSSNRCGSTAPNSCRFCQAMHGQKAVVLQMTASAYLQGDCPAISDDRTFRMMKTSPRPLQAIFRKCRRQTREYNLNTRIVA